MIDWETKQLEEWILADSGLCCINRFYRLLCVNIEVVKLKELIIDIEQLFIIYSYTVDKWTFSKNGADTG